MSWFSIPKTALAIGGILVIPLSVAEAGSLFGDVLAPQKAQAMATQAMVPLQRQQIDVCSVTGGGCQSQFTDSEGYFEFEGLTQGTYKLRTLGSDGKILDNEIQLTPNESKQLTVIAK